MLNNKFDKEASERINAVSSAATAQKVRAIFEDKPYSKRYAIAYYSAIFIRFLCNTLSFAACAFIGFYFTNSLLTALGGAGFWVAAGIGLTFALCFELVKNAFAGDFFSDLFKRQTVPTVLLWVCLAFIAFSIASSFIGAKYVPYTVKPAAVSANFEQYDKEKAQLLLQVETAQKQNLYRGVLTSGGRKIIENLHSQIESLNKQRTAHAETVAIENQKSELETVGLSQYLGYFSIVSELLYILCNAFIWYYLYRCFLELGIDNSIQTETKAAPQTVANSAFSQYGGIAAPKAETPKTPKIGFIYGQNTNDASSSAANDASSSAANDASSSAANDASSSAANDNTLSKFGVGTCAHCNTKFQRNSPAHKYCSEPCKIAGWELKTGKKFIPKRK
jgi:hypothetical protein